MKALVVIQGISGYEYAGIELAQSRFPLENYDKRAYVQTEEVFDAYIPKIIRYIPILNTLFDIAIDFLTFMFKKEARKKACKLVNKHITKLQEDGYVVDVIAHSLGTIIVLASGNKKKSVLVDNFYCYNSPLSAKLGIGRLFRNFIKHFGNRFYCNKLEYVYSKNDLLSGDFNIEVAESLKDTSTETEFINTNSGHSFKKALDVIYKR